MLYIEVSKFYTCKVSQTLLFTRLDLQITVREKERIIVLIKNLHLFENSTTPQLIVNLRKDNAGTLMFLRYRFI